MKWLALFLCVVSLAAGPTTQPMNDEDAPSFVPFVEHFTRQLDTYFKTYETLAKRQGQSISDSSAELIDYDVIHSPSVFYPIVGVATLRSYFTLATPGGGVTITTDTYNLQFGIKEGGWQVIKASRDRKIQSSPPTDLDGTLGDIEKPDRYNRILSNPDAVAKEDLVK